MSLEVIRSDFAPREKPNTTKGQRDNKRLQSQAERSSISSLRSISNLRELFIPNSHKTEHLVTVSRGPVCMTHANEAAWISSSDRFDQVAANVQVGLFRVF